MTALESAPRLHGAARLLGAALLACTTIAASAFTTGEAQLSPQAQYRADVAHCKSGQSNEDQATCMKEAGAALEAAKKHDLGNGTASYDADKTKRCQGLSGDRREDCMALMNGQGNLTTQGSVEGGGVLRETTITVPAPSSN